MVKRGKLRRAGFVAESVTGHEWFKAFSGRPRPKPRLACNVETSDSRRDALNILRMDRESVTFEDFSKSPDAVYGFDGAEFRYYLPSIFLLSAGHPNEWFRPADLILTLLDRGLDPIVLDGFTEERFAGLSTAEYQAIREWLSLMFKTEQYFDPARLARCLRTVRQLEDLSGGV